MGRSLRKGLGWRGGVGGREEGFRGAGLALVEGAEVRPVPPTLRPEAALMVASVVPRPQGTFQQMWISKQEYEEGGKQCVERKCP